MRHVSLHRWYCHYCAITSDLRSITCHLSPEPPQGRLVQGTSKYRVSLPKEETQEPASKISSEETVVQPSFALGYPSPFVVAPDYPTAVYISSAQVISCRVAVLRPFSLGTTLLITFVLFSIKQPQHNPPSPILPFPQKLHLLCQSGDLGAGSLTLAC